MTLLEGRTSFQMVAYLVWDEKKGVGEDPRMTEGYRRWWEAYRPVRLTILEVLEDDELQPIVDEVVRGEEDTPRDRVFVGGGKDDMKKRKGVV